MDRKSIKEKFFQKIKSLGTVEFEKNNKDNKFYGTFKKIKALIEEVSEKIDLEQNANIRQLLDEQVAELFTLYPEVLTIQDEYNMNLGMIAATFKLEKSVLVALDNKEASLQQSNGGLNIGMHAVENGLTKAGLKALDNHEASVQQCHILYWNIGMIAAQQGQEEVVLKALDNKEASLQQDASGMNIGMHAVTCKQKKATIKSLANKEACEQRDGWGVTLLKKAKKILSEVEIQNAINQNQECVEF